MLSQSTMDRLAQSIEAMNGDLVQAFAYHARATAQAAVVEYPGVRGRFTEYSDHITALHGLVPEGQVRREDRRLRIATCRVAWVPTLYDTVTCGDGSVWRVLSVRGGPGHPWYILQVRKVMPSA